MLEPPRNLVQLWRVLSTDIDAAAGYAADFSGHRIGNLRRLSLLLLPGVMCCGIHRLAHLAWVCRYTRLARMLARANFLLHKADISPAAHIGPGLYIPHTVGIVFHANSGRQTTLYAKCYVGPKRTQPSMSNSLDDAPRLGDRVTVGALSGVIGAIHVGNNVRIGPDVLVSTNVDAGITLVASTRCVVET